MKKTYIFSLIVCLVAMGFVSISARPEIARAAANTPPVVSIGVGNGNTPPNASPAHGSIFHGLISVFATVLDDDLDNYHLRVVKDGGTQGHTCTVQGALFAPENQGYASTILAKDACGFNFNQSVYVGATGFSNALIATLNTNDLGAFGGDGDYWLIIGALDTAGNRTASNYLDDPKIKITVDNTAPVSSGSIGARTTTEAITATGSATDTHGIATTYLSSATYNGVACGTFSPITNVQGNLNTTASWNYTWTPTADGVYCVAVSSEDSVGNIETPVVISTGIVYQKPVVVASTQSTGGGGGGNGPIGLGISLGNFGNYSDAGTPAPQSNNGNGLTGAVGYGQEASAAIAGDSSPTDSSSANVVATNETAVVPTSNSQENASPSDQGASVVESGFHFSSFWLILLVIVVAGGARYIVKKKMA